MHRQRKWVLLASILAPMSLAFPVRKVFEEELIRQLFGLEPDRESFVSLMKTLDDDLIALNFVCAAIPAVLVMLGRRESRLPWYSAVAILFCAIFLGLEMHVIATLFAFEPFWGALPLAIAILIMSSTALATFIPRFWIREEGAVALESRRT